ncbi:MAG: DUF2764 family protein [Breznakibacter sp.]
MKRNYYCLISSLPDWKLDDRKPLMNSLLFKEMLGEELHPADFKYVLWLYLPFDHANILNRLYKKESAFDERGKYSIEMVEHITNGINVANDPSLGVEPYLEDFILRFFDADEKPARVEAEKELATGWYAMLKESQNDFLIQYADFEQQSRNVFTALLGRKFDIPVANSLVGEHDMVEALKKSRARDFGLSGEIGHLDQLLQIFEMTNLQEREMRLDILRWNFYDEVTFFHYFSVEKILAFVLKLFVVERWSALDEKRGRELFEKLIAELQNSNDFPEEFKFSHGKKR